MRSLFSHLEVEATHSLGTYGNDISQHCKNALYCMHSRSLRALSNFMAALFYLARGPFRDLPSPMRPGLVSKRGDAKQTVLYILYIYTVYIYTIFSSQERLLRLNFSVFTASLFLQKAGESTGRKRTSSEQTQKNK